MDRPAAAAQNYFCLGSVRACDWAQRHGGVRPWAVAWSSTFRPVYNLLGLCYGSPLAFQAHVLRRFGFFAYIHTKYSTKHGLRVTLGRTEFFSLLQMQLQIGDCTYVRLTDDLLLRNCVLL